VITVSDTNQAADFSEREAADSSYPPFLHFGVPIDNQNTLIRLHREITKALLACQKASIHATSEKAIKTGTFSDAIVYKDSMINRQYTSMWYQRVGAKNILKLNRTIAAMTEYCIEPKGNEDEDAQNCVSQVLGEIEMRMPDAYLDVCGLGYSTSKADKMLAPYWNAMVEDANLLITN
jgi:hypothetical protein